MHFPLNGKNCFTFISMLIKEYDSQENILTKQKNICYLKLLLVIAATIK